MHGVTMFSRRILLVACLVGGALSAKAAGGGGPVAVAPRAAAPALGAPVDLAAARRFVVQALVPHVILAVKACQLKTPVEHWLRRWIGGKRQRARVWMEYTQARDDYIAVTKLEGAALARVLEDHRIECCNHYPEWRHLFAVSP